MIEVACMGDLMVVMVLSLVIMMMWKGGGNFRVWWLRDGRSWLTF
jgi:hypothetical protein